MHLIIVYFQYFCTFSSYVWGSITTVHSQGGLATKYSNIEQKKWKEKMGEFIKYMDKLMVIFANEISEIEKEKNVGYTHFFFIRT